MRHYLIDHLFSISETVESYHRPNAGRLTFAALQVLECCRAWGRTRSLVYNILSEQISSTSSGSARRAHTSTLIIVYRNIVFLSKDTCACKCINSNVIKHSVHSASGRIVILFCVMHWLATDSVISDWRTWHACFAWLLNLASVKAVVLVRTAAVLIDQLFCQFIQKAKHDAWDQGASCAGWPRLRFWPLRPRSY